MSMNVHTCTYIINEYDIHTLQSASIKLMRLFLYLFVLHNILEVGIGIHFLHVTGQHFITEDIVSLLVRQVYHGNEIWIVKNAGSTSCKHTMLGMIPGL